MSQAPVSSDITQDDKLWAALAYVFSPLVPIILMFMEDKKNNETKMATTMMESARKSRDQEHQEIKDIMELKMQNAQIELKNEQNMLKQAQ